MKNTACKFTAVITTSVMLSGCNEAHLQTMSQTLNSLNTAQNNQAAYNAQTPAQAQAAQNGAAQGQYQPNYAGTAAGGAVIGAAACKLFKNCDTKAALITGALTGALAASGQWYGERHRTEYRTKYNDLKETTRETDNYINALRQERARNERQTSANSQEIKRLERKRKKDAAFIASSKKIRENIDNEMDKNDGMRERAEIQISLLDTEITNVENNLRTTPSDEGMQAAKKQLESRRDTLRRELKEINGVRDTLISQQDDLDEALNG